jgi:ketosteroid isomerase-like protein
MYTEDAYALPPGAEMIKGRSAIEAFWRQQMQQIGDIKCTALDVKPLGRNAAREIGTCSFKTKAQPPQDGALKYAVVWEKEGNQWRLLQDIWNTNK